MVVAGCGIDAVATHVFPEDAGGPVPTEASLPDTDGRSDGPPTDGGKDARVACETVCGDAGGACDGGACVITCNAANPCEGGVTCPAGVPCKVQCTTKDTCQSFIDCTEASSCSVTCKGNRTCDKVACSGTDCTVLCQGENSCSDGGVICTATSSCNIQCTAPDPGSCASPIHCTSDRCSVLCSKGKDCTGAISVDAGDAAVVCAKDACTQGASCIGGACSLGCGGGACASQLCCEAGSCAFDGGVNACP